MLPSVEEFKPDLQRVIHRGLLIELKMKGSVVIEATLLFKEGQVRLARCDGRWFVAGTRTEAGGYTYPEWLPSEIRMVVNQCLLDFALPDEPGEPDGEPDDPFAK